MAPNLCKLLRVLVDTVALCMMLLEVVPAVTRSLVYV